MTIDERSGCIKEFKLFHLFKRFHKMKYDLKCQESSHKFTFIFLGIFLVQNLNCLDAIFIIQSITSKVIEGHLLHFLCYVEVARIVLFSFHL